MEVVEIHVRCSECGEVLSTVVTYDRASVNFEVAPCINCSDKSFNLGVDNGYDEGFEKGYGKGLEESQKG